MQLKDATETLIQRVPAFAEARSSDSSYMSQDDDSPYLVYGDFGLFLLHYLKARRWSEDGMLLQQCFEFLGEMLTSSDPEIVNLAQVGVLATLADSPDALTVAKDYLRGDGRVAFEKWLRGEW